MRMRNRRSFLTGPLGIVAVASLAAGLLTACAASESDDTAPARVEAETQTLERPGVHQVGPNEYVAVIMAFEGGFDPKEIHVPAGAKITFKGKSTDPNFVHGFLIEGVPVEMELNGFEFTEVEYTFSEPGEFNFVCYIYCSGGHPAMLGKVIVE